MAAFVLFPRFLSILTVASFFGASAVVASAEDTKEEDIPVLTEQIEEIPGPKRTVAVGKFDSIGSFAAKYGDWDIGGGLSAMLTTALVESGRFIVLERAQLQQLLTEQELKGNKVVSATTGPQLGNMTGVQYLIFGAVTEFGTEDEGTGFSVGASTGGFGNMMSNALSHQSSSGNVAFDFRVVDTTTGQVLETHKVSESIDSSGFDLSVGYKGLSIGGNDFKKTPLGEAARRAITRAVQLIAKDSQKGGWSGQVVDFNAGELFINAGESSGVKKGDVFSIERIVRRLTDPTTGEVLMLRKKTLGIVEVDMVAEKVAAGQFQPLETEPPQRGDRVVVMKR